MMYINAGFIEVNRRIRVTTQAAVVLVMKTLL